MSERPHIDRHGFMTRLWSVELEFKKPILRAVLVALIPIDIGYVIASWPIQNSLSLMLHGVILTCAVGGAVLLHFTSTEQRTFRTAYLGLATTSLVALMISNIQDYSAVAMLQYAPWMLVVTLLGTFVLGRFPGIVWAIVYLATVGVPFILSQPEFLAARQVADLKMHMIVVSITLATMVIVFEWSAGSAHRQLRAQRERAEQANRAKTDFLAQMSHEFRTPMNHIIGFTELALDPRLGPLSARHREYLSDVLRSSHHLLSLINDMLDLSKVEAGKIVLSPQQIDPGQLVRESVSVVQEQVDSKRISLSLDLEDLPPRIQADGRRLTQVMYNLLSNALKFTPPDGSIVIRGATTGDGAEIEISVRDTGEGIAAADLERIFLPFSQGDAAPGQARSGTGLGLSLSRRLVELHGGTLRAESPGKGMGSTFVMTLPAAGMIRSDVPASRVPSVELPTDRSRGTAG